MNLAYEAFFMFRDLSVCKYKCRLLFLTSSWDIIRSFLVFSACQVWVRNILNDFLSLSKTWKTGFTWPLCMIWQAVSVILGVSLKNVKWTFAQYLNLNRQSHLEYHHGWNQPDNRTSNNKNQVGGVHQRKTVQTKKNLGSLEAKPEEESRRVWGNGH